MCAPKFFYPNNTPIPPATIAVAANIITPAVKTPMMIGGSAFFIGNFRKFAISEPSPCTSSRQRNTYKQK